MGDIVTAAMVVIGDEILSGRTRDRNIGHMAAMMTAVGIDLKEVRIVADDTAAIVEAVNALRSRNTYVFTTGGIGPTHDDITADAIAAAFDLPCEHDAQALRLLAEHYEKRGIEFTEARRRMARMPRGPRHIPNPVSVAPGFVIDNVHVMAGVPAIFQAMLDALVPTLRVGARLLSKSVEAAVPEGTLGEPLGNIQKAHPGTLIGSYPKYEDGRFSTEIVVRSRSAESLDAALVEVRRMLDGLTKPERTPLR